MSEKVTKKKESLDREISYKKEAYKLRQEEISDLKREQREK